MKFTFVRHGESVANTSGRWQGQGDSPLSPQGELQAQALANYLDPAVYNRFVCSDLQRARKTAETVHSPVELRQQWREINVGSWEGLTHEEVMERFPNEIAALRSGEPIAVGGGESWRDLAQRIDRALEELTADATPLSNTLVTAHGGVISILFAGLLGVRERHPRPLGWLVNTSMSRFYLQEGITYVDAYNITPHLLHVDHKRDAYAPPNAIECNVEAVIDHDAPPLRDRIAELRDNATPGPHSLQAHPAEILNLANSVLNLSPEDQRRLAPINTSHSAGFRFSRTKAWLLRWNAPPRLASASEG